MIMIHTKKMGSWLSTPKPVPYVTDVLPDVFWKDAATRETVLPDVISLEHWRIVFQPSRRTASVQYRDLGSDDKNREIYTIKDICFVMRGSNIYRYKKNGGESKAFASPHALLVQAKDYVYVIYDGNSAPAGIARFKMDVTPSRECWFIERDDPVYWRIVTRTFIVDLERVHKILDFQRGTCQQLDDLTRYAATNKPWTIESLPGTKNTPEDVDLVDCRL